MRAFADGLFDGTVRKERSDFRPCHRPVGCAAECDGLEDSLFARTIGNASHLAPGLQGRVGGKLQDQASSVAVLYEFESKRHLDGFNKLPSLSLW